MMKETVCEKEVCLLYAGGGECEGFRERREVRTLSAQLRDSISPPTGERVPRISFLFSFLVPPPFLCFPHILLGTFPLSLRYLQVSDGAAKACGFGYSMGRGH